MFDLNAFGVEPSLARDNDHVNWYNCVHHVLIIIVAYWQQRRYHYFSISDEKVSFLRKAPFTVMIGQIEQAGQEKVKMVKSVK